MSDKTQFIDLMLAQEVLQFGDFTLKSGRKSPYFFNLGKVASGPAFAELGQAYAEAIIASGIEFDVLFGPAYKGIPIAVATSVALATHGVNVGVAYNRKEAKDHGEGGNTVGADIQGRVMIIDDVITAGTAIREAIGLISAPGAQVTAITIALDRQEKGQGEKSAIQELEQQGLQVISIIKLEHILEYLEDAGHSGDRQAIEAYRERYGID